MAALLQDIRATGCPMSQASDLTRCFAPYDQATTLIAVIELSLSSWLIAGMIPGLERQPLKKMAPDDAGLLRLLERWREEAVKAGSVINRMSVAFEAGRDRFWLARWLRTRGIDAGTVAKLGVRRPLPLASVDRWPAGIS